MIKSFLDFITGRSHINTQQLVRFLLDYIKEKDDELDCAFWRIEQLETELAEKAIALQREEENFSILANYVDRLASAIAGTEVNVFEGSTREIDLALETAIANANEQNRQLLYARTELSRLEDILSELREIVARIPTNIPP